MIYVSTSGFSYDDWVGPFFPESQKKHDRLQYFSRFFNAVELNYTYYSPPGAKGIAAHMKHAPEMKFALKGHSAFTHHRIYEQRDLDIYRSALDQLISKDALIALLLQFPYSFHATDQNRIYLEQLLLDFAGFPVAIELRHARWKTRQTYQFFREHDTTLVTTDAPAIDDLYRGGWESIGPFGYIRLHGRNKAKWWDNKHGWERYDYLYGESEISGLAKAVRELAGGSEEENKTEKPSRRLRDVYVFFNNHWQAQGAINALQLAIELGQIDLDEFSDEKSQRLRQILDR